MKEVVQRSAAYRRGSGHSQLWISERADTLPHCPIRGHQGVSTQGDGGYAGSRNLMALGLARRLAPRVAEFLSNVQSFLSRAVPMSEPAPAVECAQAPRCTLSVSPPPERIDSLQIFRGYEDGDLKIFKVFAKEGLHPEDEFVIDFLGGRTRPSILYDAVRPLAGHVLGVPVPGDFHAEAVEWIGVMKTAMTATDRYVAMEWGAGWAPWLIAGAKAAQHLGITDIRLYGVEADPSHFEVMRQHFLDNGFVPEDQVLLQAAVGTEDGSAQWPDEPDARNQWGARPIREGSAEDVDYLCQRVDRFIEVKVLAARQLVLREPTWDMVHIDIQGWEGEVCRSCIEALSERVKWVVIGVHSRIQDAELLQIFHGAGWILEHEKPTRFRYLPSQVNFEAMVTADGTQVWRNPRLAADPRDYNH
jgi:FkbM family methyltransferase